MKAAPSKIPSGPTAVSLIEEAVHLVRMAPVAAWAIYLAGAVPWVLGLGYFWAFSSWFAPRPEQILWQAIGLCVLFVWLKVTQAEFCGRLRAVRFGVKPTALTLRGLLRTAKRQARVQGWAMLLLPIAAVLTVPAGWAWMFFENTTALAATADADGDTLEKRAGREAKRWPGPAHLALLLFSGVWLCVWINVASLFYVVPWLLRTLLGVENMFGLSGWSALNSTLFALVTILTWLAVDPLVKAYHVLRTFYGEALHTGEDLRLELRKPVAHTRAKIAVIALALLAAGAAFPGAGNLRAATAPTTGPAALAVVGQASEAEVNNALDEALRGGDFRWSLQPLPVIADDTAADGWMKRFVREGVEVVGRIVQDVGNFFRGIGDWFDRLFKKDKAEKAPKKEKAAPSGDGTAMRVVLYILLGLCAVALLWMLWTTWKKRPPAPRTLSASGLAVAATPDLNDEKLEASRMPTDEWLELARRQLALGEWRLALRALYLGSLAGLGARGLVTLARAKTNLDYERELSRRAAGQDGVVAGFRARRLAFECVWYGRTLAGENQVRAWLAELEREAGGTA